MRNDVCKTWGEGACGNQALWGEILGEEWMEETHAKTPI